MATAVPAITSVATSVSSRRGSCAAMASSLSSSRSVERSNSSGGGLDTCRASTCRRALLTWGTQLGHAIVALIPRSHGVLSLPASDRLWSIVFGSALAALFALSETGLLPINSAFIWPSGFDAEGVRSGFVFIAGLLVVVRSYYASSTVAKAEDLLVI